MQIKAYMHRYRVSPCKFFFLTNPRDMCKLAVLKLQLSIVFSPHLLCYKGIQLILKKHGFLAHATYAKAGKKTEYGTFCLP